MTAIENLPPIPGFNYVIDDSPSCHQSLKYWGAKSNEIGKTVHEIASGLHHYHDSGAKHHHAGSKLSEVLSAASKTMKSDPILEEPLTKFADAFNRIECYRDMLLTQTEMLGVQPLVKMVKGFEKMKKVRSRLTKASENLHVNWEKFAALPHQSRLQDPHLLDKQGHNMITASQKYQLLLAQYIDAVRDTNNRKKIVLLQKLLEHMLAEFSFYNYCSQILKDLEPYMNNLFTNIQEKLYESEKLYNEDEDARRKVEIEIDRKAQEERKLFPNGEQLSPHAQGTGRFLNKFGGMISGVKDLRKTYHGGTGHRSVDEQDWEVIDDPTRKQLDDSNGSSSPPPVNSQFYLPTDEGNNTMTPQDIARLENQSDKSDSKPTENQSNSIQATDAREMHTVDEKSISETEEDGKNKVAPEPDQPQSSFSRFPFTYKSTHEDEFCKKGYLRIKQKAFPKSKYPLLYFILDKKYGEMLSQGQDQRQPTLFAKLMLSAVRPCDVTETDRNYCFQLITSETEHTLQAKNREECESWMQAIQDGIAAALDGNQDRKRMNARGRSVRDNKKTDKSDCQNVVERLKAIEGNTSCADCNCPRPGWASASIGCVICIECSGIHRGLGVHISKVKSLSLDKWDTELVEFMESQGNAKVNMIYEANLGDTIKINRTSSKTERLQYILAKYVEKRFVAKQKDIHESTEENKQSVESSEKNGDSNNHESNNSDPNNSDKSDPNNTLSVMCLVKDCEDCNLGKHGTLNGKQPVDNSNPTLLSDSLEHTPLPEPGEKDKNSPFKHPLE